ncbi:MAG: SIS domain-containing protein [Rhodospirillales bacterium]|nr:SIS domain-containing protein [Rhodospirillales bacterium]
MNLEKNIKTIATRVLLNEAKAVENLANYIDGDFEACVKEIFNSKGRVVVTGVGKSAIVANKIVATLNSTGTPSLFMHAADAIHGDLGMVQAEDIVICLSKSGNTPEIKVLVPLLKRRGSRLVALYLLFVWATARLRPELAPPLPPELLHVPRGELQPLVLKAFLPPVFLIALIKGSILFGWSTPSEAGAVGAFGAILLAWFNGRLNTETMSGVCHSAARTVS